MIFFFFFMMELYNSGYLRFQTSALLHTFPLRLMVKSFLILLYMVQSGSSWCICVVCVYRCQRCCIGDLCFLTLYAAIQQRRPSLLLEQYAIRDHLHIISWPWLPRNQFSATRVQHFPNHTLPHFQPKESATLTFDKWKKKTHPTTKDSLWKSSPHVCWWARRSYRLLMCWWSHTSPILCLLNLSTS